MRGWAGFRGYVLLGLPTVVMCAILPAMHHSNDHSISSPGALCHQIEHEVAVHSRLEATQPSGQNLCGMHGSHAGEIEASRHPKSHPRSWPEAGFCATGIEGMMMETPFMKVRTPNPSLLSSCNPTWQLEQSGATFGREGPKRPQCNDPLRPLAPQNLFGGVC